MQFWKSLSVLSWIVLPNPLVGPTRTIKLLSINVRRCKEGGRNGENVHMNFFFNLSMHFSVIINTLVIWPISLR